MLTLEFYDPSQPRSKDGKWSKWGSQSANPTQVGDRQSVDKPWDDDYADLDTTARRVFNHDLPNGHRSVVEEVRNVYQDDELGVLQFDVHGRIEDADGNKVGYFDRGFLYTPNNGQVRVQHSNLFLNTESQGKGIGDSFIRQSIVEYNKMGVGEIVVNAGGSVGKYNWARQGFRVYPEESRYQVVGNMLAFARDVLAFPGTAGTEPFTDQERASLTQQIDDLTRANDAGEDVQPRHVAALGKNVRTWERSGRSLWVGKSALLNGLNWTGHFVLNPEPGTEGLSMLDSEEFYDPSQPRDKDGKWKQWSGVSATPDARRPVSRLPVDDEWLADEGFESEEAFLKSWYTHDLPDGYRAEATKATPALDKFGSKYGPESSGPIRWKVEGKILSSSGREIGRFKRKIEYNDETRDLTVTHDVLVLDPDHQGRGLADAFNAQAVEKYQRYGVRAIRLHAAMDVGGYAWARQGFRIFPEDEREREIDRLLKRAEYAVEDNEHQFTKAQRSKIMSEIKRLRTANRDGDDVQPIHVATIGESVAQYDTDAPGKPSYRSWVGKSALMGSGWMGHYILDPDKPVVASSTSLHHACLRPKYGASLHLVEALSRRMGWLVTG